MGKAKKKKKPTVRGPQKELFRASNVLGWGDPASRAKFDEDYTRRMKFYALRVPASVIKAFKAKAGKEHAGVIRAYMAKVAGVELPDNEGDEGDE